MSVILKKFIGNDQVADEKILLDNNSALRARNAANSANLDLLKANAADELELSRILNAGGFELKNLGAPTAGSSAATKASVDAAIAMALSGATSYAHATAVANVTVSNPGTAVFDGVTLANGEFLLLQQQTTASQNGVYVFNGSGAALTRAPLWDAASEFAIGRLIVVLAGATKADTVWANQAAVATVDTDVVDFDQVAAVSASANTALSNLTTTSINQSLIPNGTFNLGTNNSFAEMWNNAHFKGSVKFFNGAGDTLHISGNTSTASPSSQNMNPTFTSFRTDTTDKMTLTTIGTSGTAFTQSISLETGNADGSGASGSVLLYAGTSATGTRGSVRFDALAAELRARASAAMPLRFYDADNSNYVQIKSAAVIASDVTLTLPATAGTLNQVLTTDGTGVLSWSTAAASGANTALGNLTTTAINQDLVADNQVARNLGTSGVPWSTLHLNSQLSLRNGTSDSFSISGAGGGTTPSGASAQARLFTSNFSGAGSNLALYTNANSGASATANIRLETGNQTSSGDSGSIHLRSGTSTATRGSVVMDALSADLMARASAAMALRFYDADNSNYVQMKSPAVVASNFTLTLPDTAGTADQFLKTDGTGVLSWASAAAAGANTTLSNLTSPTAVNQHLNLRASKSAKFFTNTDDFGVTVIAPNGMTNNNTFILPASAGNGGEFLQTDGSTGATIWAPVPAAGANTQLSNLVSPVSINQPLLFALGTSGQVGTADSASATSGLLTVKSGEGIGYGSGNVSVTSGSTDGFANSGVLELATGGISTAGASSGALAISTGSVFDLPSGQIQITTGAASATGGTSGNLTVATGTSLDAATGNVVVQSGIGELSGNVDLRSGDANNSSGNLTVATGNALTNAAVSGQLTLSTGFGLSNSTGDIGINTGSVLAGVQVSGDIVMQTGGVYDGTSGSLNIVTGTAANNGTSGPLAIQTGVGTATSTVATGGLTIGTGAGNGSGDLELFTGDSYSLAGPTGDIFLTTGNVNDATTGTIALTTGDSPGTGSSGPITLQTGSVVDALPSGDVLLASGAAPTQALRGNIQIDGKRLTMNGQTLLQLCSLGAAPATPAAGDTYFNTVKSAVRYYSGAVWVDVLPINHQKETMTLSAGDITNQYIDLAHLAAAGSIHFLVRGANNPMWEGAAYEYTVSTVGGVSRLTFLNDIATGGLTALTAGDIVQIVYVWNF